MTDPTALPGRPAPVDDCIRIAVYDHTTDATPPELRPGLLLPDIIAAILEQIDQDYRPEHGCPPVVIRLASGPEDRSPGEEGAHFRDTIPVDGALAYHTVVGGVPDIEIGCDLFETISTGLRSQSGGFSHEVCERLLDGGANGWKDKGDGVTTGAEEVCDPVQNTGYAASNGVALSNFVRRAYFVPGAAGPWDFLGVMRAQDDIAAWGYEIQAAAATATTQVGGERAAALAALEDGDPLRLHPHRQLKTAGELTGAQLAAKRHVYSRARRRGLRF